MQVPIYRYEAHSRGVALYSFNAFASAPCVSNISAIGALLCSYARRWSGVLPL